VKLSTQKSTIQKVEALLDESKAELQFALQNEALLLAELTTAKETEAEFAEALEGTVSKGLFDKVKAEMEVKISQVTAEKEMMGAAVEAALKEQEEAKEEVAQAGLQLRVMGEEKEVKGIENEALRKYLIERHAEGEVEGKGV